LKCSRINICQRLFLQIGFNCFTFGGFTENNTTLRCLCVKRIIICQQMLSSGVFNLPARTPALKRSADTLTSVSKTLTTQSNTNLNSSVTNSQVVFDLPPRTVRPKLLNSQPDHNQQNYVQQNPIQPTPRPTSTESSVQVFQLPERKTWDKQSIDSLARSSEVFEKTFGSNLQEWLGDTVQVQPHENKYNRHDFYVFKKDNPQKRLWIELECGVTQDQWKSSIHDNRRRWVQGLNVVSRKIVEGKHFDLFIKHNTACNSFFASSYEFIKTHGKVQTQKTNSLKFKTDNTIYSLPWSLVDQHHPDLIVDDREKLCTMIQALLSK
jgi:hypothetical protein